MKSQPAVTSRLHGMFIRATSHNMMTLYTNFDINKYLCNQYQTQNHYNISILITVSSISAQWWAYQYRTGAHNKISKSPLNNMAKSVLTFVSMK